MNLDFDHMSKKDKCAVVACGGSLTAVTIYVILEFIIPATHARIATDMVLIAFAILLLIVSTILGFIGLGSKQYKKAALVSLIPFVIFIIVVVFNLIRNLIDPPVYY